MSQPDGTHKLEIGKALIGCLSAVVVACISGSVALATNWDKVQKLVSQMTPSDTLYKEEFTSADTGWDQYEDVAGNLTEYSQGTYRIFVNEPVVDIIGTPGVSYKDVSIKVSSQYLAGPEDNTFGIVCRFQDVDNYYEFLISTDGYYGIGKMVGGEFAWLGNEQMLASEFIHTGSKTNQMQAVCKKDTLSLSVNGHQLLKVQDTDLSSAGDFGLIVGSFEETGVDISFDHLTVTKP